MSISLIQIMKTVFRRGRRSYVGIASNIRQSSAYLRSTERSQHRFSCVTPSRRHVYILSSDIQRLIHHCQGYIPLPKSALEHRIRSNSDVYDFELTPEEVAHLDRLDESAFHKHYRVYPGLLVSSGLVTDWDPTDTP